MKTQIRTIKYILISVLFLLGVTQAMAQLTQTSTIAGPVGTVDSFTNGYTFAYATSGAPWNGALISFGGLLNRYDCQISTDYGPGGGGNHMSFRTHNGDAPNIWNPWREVWHSGNLNRADVDFTARTLNCTNVYTNGNLWSKQIKVALTNPWPDYVFKPNYKLPGLDYVENYIDKNNHLPEVPPETEIKKNGIDVGEMNAVLLKKVEELTLYMIEQNKKTTELMNTVKAQQKEIELLKKKN